MQCHTDGGSLVWDWKAHDEMSDAFADIAGDREIKVLIHTGTGENYNADWGPAPVEKPLYLAMDGQKGLKKLDEKAWYGRMLIENVLAVEVPMISAVNGPCNIHSEVPLLGDIVLASEDAYFQDLAHFPRGMVPGDGQHVIWPCARRTQPGAVHAPDRKEAERPGGARMGRGGRSAAQGPAPRSGVGAGARAGEAASPRAALHPHAVHPGLEARLPRRAGPRPRPRDVRAAPVLPGRWRDGAARSALGQGALVGLNLRPLGGVRLDAVVHSRVRPWGNRPFQPSTIIL